MDLRQRLAVMFLPTSTRRNLRGDLSAMWRVNGQQNPGSFIAIVAIAASLNVIGLTMVLSASSVTARSQLDNSLFFFQRQAMWAFVGAGAFLITSRFNYRLWQQLVIPLMATSVALLVIVLIPQIGIEVSGSRRWLGTDSLRIQPSELAKLALVVFLAQLFARGSDRSSQKGRISLRGEGPRPATLRPALIVVGGFSLLILREPDMGTSVVLVLIAMAVFLAGGVEWKRLGGLIVGAGVLGIIVAIAEPYRRDRVMSFLDPWAHANDSGYQVTQGIIAIASGGFTGVGLGAGSAKWSFLPNAHTDFIFAIIGEEAGLVGCATVIALFGALGFLGVRAAMRSQDRFGALLAIGITAWIVGQAMINIGTVLGLMPVTGVPLPFVSFGGSALVTTMGALGILANVARQGVTSKARNEIESSRRNSGSPRTALSAKQITRSRGTTSSTPRSNALKSEASRNRAATNRSRRP